MHVFGLDIGGTVIKGAPVDALSGQLLAERFRLLTSDPASPLKAVVKRVAKVAAHFGWQSYCPVAASRRCSAAHTLFNRATGCSFGIANDADVAGLAEMHFGVGRGSDGVLQVGDPWAQGLARRCFPRGQPGAPQYRVRSYRTQGAMDAEHWAADSALAREDLIWSKWAKRVTCRISFGPS